MKIAVVTDDQKTISPHFGMAHYYLVYDIKEGLIVGKEVRQKPFHGREGMNHEHKVSDEASLHGNMLSNVVDCEAVIGRGMGHRMYSSIIQLGIKPYVTDTAMADDAVQECIKGTLDNHTERLH